MMFTNKYEVELLEFDSPELSAVNCARVSFAKQTDQITEKDKRLLKYLKEHKHNSVFYQYFHYFSLNDRTAFDNFKKLIKESQPFGYEMMERGCYQNGKFFKVNDYIYNRCKNLIDKFIEEGKFVKKDKDIFNNECYIEACIANKLEVDGIIDYPALRMSTITTRVSIPMFIKNQIIRHSSGMQFNEVSRRYTAENLKFFDFGGRYRKQSQDNKQGSIEDEYIADFYPMQGAVNGKDLAEKVINYYNEMVKKGACREQVRANLPQTMYTDMIMTFNLNTLIKMIKERTQKDTQKETRDFAEQVKRVVVDKYPILKEVF